MIFYHPPARQGDTSLSKEESFHCIKVLRQKKGDLITVFDGEGGIYTSEILTEDPAACRFTVRDKQQAPADPYYLHLAIAPTKNTDRMEWMLEKCVEVGLHEITFLLCENSERSRLRTDRLEKKMVAAMKQAQRPFRTVINEPVAFTSFLRQDTGDHVKHIAYVPAAGTADHLKDTKTKHRYIVMVGPEGDFSENEIQRAQDAGFIPTSLGHNRLRTETAGLMACHTLSLVHF